MCIRTVHYAEKHDALIAAAVRLVQTVVTTLLMRRMFDIRKCFMETLVGSFCSEQTFPCVIRYRASFFIYDQRVRDIYRTSAKSLPGTSSLPVAGRQLTVHHRL